MYNSAYVFKLDFFLTKSIQSYLVHPYTEARSVRKNAILVYQYYENSQTKLQLHKRLAALLAERDQRKDTNYMLHFNKNICDLRNKTADLTYHHEQMNLNYKDSLSLDLIYFISPCVKAIRTNKMAIFLDPKWIHFKIERAEVNGALDT